MAVLVGLVASLLALPAAAQEDGICGPALVTHTPDGTTGEARAVAITAQAIDLEAGSGWVNVAWEVATGVELTAVSVVDTGGGVRTDPDPASTGAATSVAALVFCGSVDPTLFQPADPDPEPDPEPEPEPEPEPTPPDAPDDEAAAPGSGSDTSGSDPVTTDPPDGTTEDGATDPNTSAPTPAAPPAPAPPAPTGDGEGAPTDDLADTDTAPASDADGADSEGSDEPDATGPDDTDPDPDPAEEPAPDPLTDEPSTEEAGEVTDAEVEVLGVQLTQEDERTRAAWPMLLLALGLGVLAVGLGVSVWRHWPAR